MEQDGYDEWSDSYHTTASLDSSGNLVESGSDSGFGDGETHFSYAASFSPPGSGFSLTPPFSGSEPWSNC